jgi:hypothetical protein
MPSLAYGTPASSLTTKECEDIQRPVVAEILPKMGIIWNSARAVVFGPSQYCGLGLDYLSAVQGRNRIQYLIGHLRSKSLTGKLIRNQLEYTQLEVGCETNPLALKYERYKPLILCPSFVTALWEYLHMCLATTDVTPQWSPKKSRIQDVAIMTALTDPSTGLSTKYLRTINRCRLYLQVFLLSEIATLKGDAISIWAISGTRSETLTGTWNWPIQQRPPKTA